MAFFFVLRKLCSWALLIIPTAIIFGVNVVGPWMVLVALVIGMLVVTGSIAHLRRARLVAGKLDKNVLSSRQRLRIEMPLEAGEAFDLVEAVIGALPHVADMDSAVSTLSMRARIERVGAFERDWHILLNPLLWFAARSNLVVATVAPGDGTSSVTVVCEPDIGGWSDWLSVDDASNYETGEAIRRALSRRVAERRRREEDRSRQTETEKELAEARLGLLTAQVEPHFLYNTLASAQVLVRSDPARADEMLGNLITYLRNSLPKSDRQMETLGAELERTLAYLDILKVRMGNRLNVVADVAPGLEAVPLPAMMLQTLAENAIKHGLEAKPGGGTIWLSARLVEGQLEVTVADDGRGLGAQSSGTGIGLKNVRDRLRLIYGEAARFTITANFPNGVAATLSVPAGEAVR
ncbi:histidine kinase [Devosia nitrariae]|nr:histidine kinase [Devosia nitrariae]